jgi:hypothetical protein
LGRGFLEAAKWGNDGGERKVEELGLVERLRVHGVAARLRGTGE